MIVNDFRGFGEITWEQYCDKKFTGDAAQIGKCRSKPMGILTLAPWTVVGAAQRGLPNPGSDALNLVTSIATPGSGQGGTDYSTPGDEGIFGIPKMAMWIGLGVLGVGAGLLVLKKSRKKR